MNRILPGLGALLCLPPLYLAPLCLTATAWAAEPAIQPLDTGWQFRIDQADVAAQPGLSDWHAASVPGSVQADMLALGLLPDPFVGTNEAAVQWVGLVDWDERLAFDVSPEMLAHPHLDLVFDGIDTLADVSVNGTALLATNNQFRRWRIPAAGVLRAGRNQIDVVLHSPVRRLQAQLATQPVTLPGEFDTAFGDEPAGRQTAPYIRKAAYGYGWDWGPRIVTQGIWHPVRLEATDAIRLTDFHVAQTRVDTGVAVLEAQVTLEADRAGPASLDLSLEAPEDSAPIQMHRDVMLEAGRNRLSLPIRLAHPILWFPVDMGDAALYRARLRVDLDGVTQARAEKRIGLRSVVLRRDPDGTGRDFALVVNGVPVFAKGANLIPFDSLPSRTTPARMLQILQDAHDAHMNMLRVWGGGAYLDDAFYEMADRLGIMIWQDFMFGGAITPPDTAFRDNARIEAEQQVLRLRDHPSIVLWCGNNEVQTGWESWADRQLFKERISPDERERLVTGMTVLFGDVLRHVVEDEGGVPYWATTPGTDLDGTANVPDDGDMHVWDVWSGSAKPVSGYLDVTPRFQSEYGLQSMPDRRTVAAFAGPAGQSIDSAAMRAHQKYDGGNGNDRLLLYVRREYGEPRDLASLIYLSQLMQADGIALAAEHLRAARPHSMGSLYWQLNDAWPGISWSSIDWFGRPKILQFRAARFYAPVALTVVQKDGRLDVGLASDRIVPLHGHWRLRLLDLDGTLRAERNGAIEAVPLSATKLLSETEASLLHGADPTRTVAVIDADEAGTPLGRELVWFAHAKALHLPDPGLSVVAQAVPGSSGNTELVVTSHAVARAVWLDTGSQEGRLSDNGFDLLPGETRVIRAQGIGDAALLGRETTVRSLYGAALPLP